MRHNRLKVSVHKDPKLQRLLNDILAEVRANRPQPSPTIRPRRTATGTTFEALTKPAGSGVPIKQFQVVEEQYNYLKCLEWNGTETVGSEINIAKPYDLRLYIQPSHTGGNISWAVTIWGNKVTVSLVKTQDGRSFLPNVRAVSYGGGGVASLSKTYYEFIDPPYLPTYTVPDPRPDGWGEDTRGRTIFAMKSKNGVGDVWDFNSTTNESTKLDVEWVEMPGQRIWRKELEQCDGGVTRWVRVAASEIYPNKTLSWV